MTDRELVEWVAACPVERGAKGLHDFFTRLIELIELGVIGEPHPEARLDDITLQAITGARVWLQPHQQTRQGS